MVQISVPSNEGIILDFFSVQEQQPCSYAIECETWESKFICVQLPEACDTDSDAAKAGFGTIATSAGSESAGGEKDCGGQCGQAGL
jgi:hypothetical protein